MERLAKLLPYVLRFRRPLLLSIAASAVIAGLWGATLLLAFPLVKVLMQGQSFSAYVEDEIAKARRETDQQAEWQSQLEAQLKAQHGEPNWQGSVEELRLLKEQSRAVRRQSAAAWRLMTFSWLDVWLIPWLPRDQFAMLALILAVLLVVTVLRGVCTFCQEWLIGYVVEGTLFLLRNRLMRRAGQLDWQTLGLLGTPTLMARFTHDLSHISQGLSQLGGKLVVEPMKAMVCIGCAFFVNWQLTVLSFITAPLGAWLFQRIGKRLKHASRKQMELMARIYRVLDETLRSFRVVQAFGYQRHHRAQFHRENKDYYRRTANIIRSEALTSPTLEFLATCAVFAALLPGAYLVLRQKTTLWGVQLTNVELDIAELALLYAFLAGLLDPLRKLSSVFPKLKKATAACDRVFQLMDEKTRVPRVAAPQHFEAHHESLDFSRITFTYAATSPAETDRPPALDDVSLTIPFGEVVAIVGGNGSGKSTLVNLLPRLYDPEHGQVKIDGHDIRQADLADLRRQMGMVTQETFLFNRSIWENLQYGNPHATREEILAVAERAHVTSFVDQLPDRWETQVGEKGSRLSGGQRQRVALARALLRNPSILILDEATSAIDAESELLIHRTLRNFTAGRTTLIVTHALSPSLLDFVTRVVLMDHGRIIAAGTHAALLQSSPAYQALYHSHTRQRAA